jgi:hypothetical protein
MRADLIPPWISLRGLAVELCPANRPLNDFKRELRRILRDAGVRGEKPKGFRRKVRFSRAELERLTPWLIETWIRVRNEKRSA